MPTAQDLPSGLPPLEQFWKGVDADFQKMALGCAANIGLTREQAFGQIVSGQIPSMAYPRLPWRPLPNPYFFGGLMLLTMDLLVWKAVDTQLS